MIEGRVVRKLSQEFSLTEYRILGALLKLDEFLFKYGRSAEPFREYPATMTEKTENQLGIVPGLMPIRKWNFLFVGQAIQLTLTQKRPLTAISIKNYFEFP